MSSGSRSLFNDNTQNGDMSDIMGGLLPVIISKRASWDGTPEDCLEANRNILFSERSSKTVSCVKSVGRRWG